MSLANDGVATSTSESPPVGSTVDSKSAHPHASAITVRSVAPRSRAMDSARIERLLVQMNPREYACREQAPRRVEELARESRRSPRVHGAAEESVGTGRAQLEDRMIGIARAIAAPNPYVEDRLLPQHADPAVWEERQTRHGARHEHLGGEMPRLEV